MTLHASASESAPAIKKYPTYTALDHPVKHVATQGMSGNLHILCFEIRIILLNESSGN
jgi:hypothetical protein